MFLRKLSILGGVLLPFCAGLSLEAASIGVNFIGGGAGPGGSLDPQETAGAPGVAQGNWNNAGGADGTIMSLLNDAGQHTGAGMSWISGPITYEGVGDNLIPDTGNDFSLMKGYLTGADTIVVEGISYEAYDVVVYFSGELQPPADNWIGFNLFQPNVFPFLRLTGLVNPTFDGTYEESTGVDQQTAAPGNYVRFRGLTGEAFSIGPAGGNNTSLAPMNGLQIVQVPEPKVLFTLSLATLVLVMLIGRRTN